MTNHILKRGIGAVLIVSMIISLDVQAGGGGSLPPNWWLMSKAKPIHSTTEFNTLIEGEMKHKFVFIDFYMEHCPWCYYILDDLNRLIDDMNVWYGPELVEVIKIDGQKIKGLSSKYSIQSYPAFVAIQPNSGGKSYSTFKYSPRNYDTLKKWMLEVMGNTPLHSEAQQSTALPVTPAAQSYNNDQELVELRQQFEQLTQSQNLKTQDYAQNQKAINDVMQKIYEQGYVGNQKIDKLLTLLDSALSEPTPVVETNQLQANTLLTSPICYILGLVSGSIMSVIGVQYITKQRKLSKQTKRTKMRRNGGPSTDSPLKGFDEEKSA